jgi:type 1 glutamine amidotransferase
MLLTTDHPKMVMKAMAWTHEFRAARVFCLQPGHNNDHYADPIFRTMLSRGIHWAAGRL